MQIEGTSQRYTLKTDSAGAYAFWLDKRNNPLSMIIAKDGYVPATRAVRTRAGVSVRLDVRAAPTARCS